MTISPDLRKVTIDPSSDLESGTEYYVLIDAEAFECLDGDEYAGISDATTWNFTTADGHATDRKSDG